MTVYLVDDEPGMLKALTRLLEAEGFAVKSFHSAAEFLAEPEPVGCVVLDVAMPGLDGLELQQRLTGNGSELPVIFLTGHGDIPMSVRAIKSGAVDFLTKPVKEDDLIRVVKLALELAASRTRKLDETTRLRTLFATLTPREQEVMCHVIAGKPGKVIAAELGTGEQTIKVHRMRVMQKMRVSSLVELVHAAERLGVSAAGE
jgi:FixJ family two-component response regulator